MDQNSSHYYGAESYGQQQPAQPTYSMKWYKFLIYFALFASAVAGVINAVMYFNGSMYNNFKDMFYEYFGSVKTVDTIFGIVLIVVAVFAIVVRFSLSGYKKIAPTLLTVYFAVMYASTGVYYLTVNSMIDKKSMLVNGRMIFKLADYSTQLIFSAIGTAVGGLVMIVLNLIYFKKRKDLFTE